MAKKSSEYESIRPTAERPGLRRRSRVAREQESTLLAAERPGTGSRMRNEFFVPMAELERPELRKKTLSSEYDFFLSVMPTLSIAVAPALSQFAIKALAKHLITKGNCSDAINERNSAENRVSSLLLILLGRIEGNSDEFYVIMEILQSIPMLKQTVESLHPPQRRKRDISFSCETHTSSASMSHESVPPGSASAGEISSRPRVVEVGSRPRRSRPQHISTLSVMGWRARFSDYTLDVVFTGEILGCGSFGQVEKVICDGQECAAKSVYDHLVHTRAADGYNKILGRYYMECELMTQLNHRNVVKFLGVCFKPGHKWPLLVMIKLNGDLYDLLEGYRNPNLPLSLKLSLLDDVVKGLHYLHNFKEDLSIVHRDLNAKNVLLAIHCKTSRMVAKITDFGVSRIIDKKGVQQFTALPGAMDYMPPEAVAQTCYSPSMDVFSFGHLTLVTLTQNTSGCLLSSTYWQNGEHIARSEVERRAILFEELKRIADNIQCNLELKNLVINCIDNDSHKRPRSCQVMSRLEEIRTNENLAIPANPDDVKRAAGILKESEDNRTQIIPDVHSSINLVNAPFLLCLLVLSILLIIMANSGVLTHLILNAPFFMNVASGVTLYGIAYLFDLILLGRTRLWKRSHFLTFMAVWNAITSILIMSVMPPLKLNAERIIFRPTEYCNMFNNPTIYICSNGGNRFYTTTVRSCDHDWLLNNASNFYIISMWIPSKDQYRLKNKVSFQPDNDVKFRIPASYYLPQGYCIQEYRDDSVPKLGQLRVAFFSWTEDLMHTLDTGYINKSDLKVSYSGWYRVSNCMWEITRLLPLKNYCQTGYVSNAFVTLPRYTARLLYDATV